VPVNRKLFCLMLEPCLISLYRITKAGIVSHTHTKQIAARPLCFPGCFFKKDGKNKRRGDEELDKKKSRRR
jgi:hypothetical protein